MDLRGTRLVLAGTGLVALALCIGSVSAAPLKNAGEGGKMKGGKAPISSIDPAVAKQIVPRVLKQQDALELQKKTIPLESIPTFKIRRLDPIQRAELLGQPDPASLPGPIVFNARTSYHNDKTYMEILAYSGGGVGVRPLRNYLHFMGPADVMASPYLRPGVLIHYTAQQGMRYLLECAVDAGASTNFTAADGTHEYSVRSDDKATLLYMREQLAATTEVVIQIAGDQPGWYLDGCELTAIPR